jgi:hypothetical protein
MREPKFTPFDPSIDEPPKPITAEQHQFYLIGKHVEEREKYLPMSKLWRGSFSSYRKAKLFLDNHPEIRRRSPRRNRLDVHVVDWYFWNKEAGNYVPSLDELEALLDTECEKGEAERAEIAAEIRRKRQGH